MEKLHEDGDVVAWLQNNTVVFEMGTQGHSSSIAVPVEVIHDMDSEYYEAGERVFGGQNVGLIVEYLGNEFFRIEPRLGPELRIKQSAVDSIVESLP